MFRSDYAVMHIPFGSRARQLVAGYALAKRISGNKPLLPHCYRVQQIPTVQWRYTGNGAFTYPIAFPNAMLGAWLTKINGSSTVSTAVGSRTLSNAEAYLSEPAAAGTVLMLGY